MELIIFLNCIAVKQERDIWRAIEYSLKHAEELLQHSSETVVFKVGNKVQSREIGLHDPPSKVLGVCRFYCGSLVCQSQTAEMRYKNKTHTHPKKEAIHQVCNTCQRQSAWIKVRDVEWDHLVTGSKCIFWHIYPATQTRWLYS